jgi:hypothetical protein
MTTMAMTGGNSWFDKGAHVFRVECVDKVDQFNDLAGVWPLGGRSREETTAPLC